MNDKLIELIPKLLWLVSAWIVIYIFMDPLKSAINTGNVKAKFLEFEIEIESDEGDKDSVTLENFITFIQDNNNILQGTDIQLRNAIDSLGKIVLLNSKKYPKQSIFKNNDLNINMPATASVKSEPEQKRVLWVDDHPQNNVLYVNRLQKSGYIVDKAINEQEAQTLLKSKKYNVVITDMGRTENGIKNNLQGIETITSVKNNQKNSKVPVIIFSSSIDSKSLAIDAGAHDMLNSGSKLIMEIEKLLNS